MDSGLNGISTTTTDGFYYNLYPSVTYPTYPDFTWPSVTLTNTFNIKLPDIEIRKAENGFVAKKGSVEYVFKTTKQLFAWLEKEMDGS